MAESQIESIAVTTILVKPELASPHHWQELETESEETHLGASTCAFGLLPILTFSVSRASATCRRLIFMSCTDLNLFTQFASKPSASTFTNRAFCLAVILLLSIVAPTAQADVIDSHPAAEQLKQIFAAPKPADFKSTGVTRADYVKLIAGDVDFFKKYQNKSGAIIDPVSKGERQYSTPAYAVAAALLVKEGGRADLLDSASAAMSCALTALIEKRPADQHADFYIPMLVHAYRLLKDVVPKQQAAAWAAQFQSIDPQTMYRADLRAMNWNIVSSSGELLRRKDGLVAQDQLAAQFSYLEKCVLGHVDTFTSLGLVQDPGAPMAYDSFSRLWLEDVFADDAYSGAKADDIQAFLREGGLSTLLLLSPTGEWATGGRSGMHNWTDVENAVICEINASYWKKQGRNDVAGAFKRAAHLAFESAARWRRPGGDLWIIKNRAEPQTRLAYEPYSNHSQYNLLPMAMLAIAYSRSDETIAEAPTPAETGGYVFDARKTFHKIAAAAAGYYVLIDTDADPHYNATGLQRVHKTGVLFPTLSDSTAGERAYQPTNAPKAAITPCIEWKSAADATKWIGLSDFNGEEKLKVTSADLKVDSTTSPQTKFAITYHLTGKGEEGRVVTEDYTLSADGVTCASTVTGGSPPAQCRVHFPILVSDGAEDLSVKLTSNTVATAERGSTTSIQVSASDLTDDLKLQGPRIVAHNGYMQEAVAGIHGPSASWRISLAQDGGPNPK